MVGVMFVLVLYLQMACGYPAVETGWWCCRTPEHLRARFIEDSTAAARHYSPAAPPGGPAAVTAGHYERVVADTFAAGFTDAMRTTLAACAAVLVIATLSGVLFRRPHRHPQRTRSAR